VTTCADASPTHEMMTAIDDAGRKMWRGVMDQSPGDFAKNCTLAWRTVSAGALRVLGSIGGRFVRERKCGMRLP
jgi:hypothetical protein